MADDESSEPASKTRKNMRGLEEMAANREKLLLLKARRIHQAYFKRLGQGPS